MKLGYKVALLGLAILAVGFVTDALATPHMNGAVIKTRIFNDCPVSVLNVTNNYPASIVFDETGLFCFGWANLHNWTYSADGGATPAVLNNGDAFGFAATVVLSGGDVNGAEAGLRLGPWWSQDVDGRFNIRIPDGEIACFGGVLPFYSFTGTNGIHYVAGQPIRLEVMYQPHYNTAQFPGEIQYRCFWQGVWYTSPWLPFGNCTPGEEWHGCYGIMNDARAGGYAQNRLTNGQQPSDVLTSFFDICWAEAPVPALPTTWGKVKGLYR
jgi:hypothetical protein